jgi:hypothetical protein
MCDVVSALENQEISEPVSHRFVYANFVFSFIYDSMMRKFPPFCRSTKLQKTFVLLLMISSSSRVMSSSWLHIHVSAKQFGLQLLAVRVDATELQISAWHIAFSHITHATLKVSFPIRLLY